MLVAANLPSSPILVTLMTEALSSSEMSVLTRATRCKHPRESHSSVFVILPVLIPVSTQDLPTELLHNHPQYSMKITAQYISQDTPASFRILVI
jgi:hypothetical protein